MLDELEDVSLQTFLAELVDEHGLTVVHEAVWQTLHRLGDYCHNCGSPIVVDEPHTFFAVGSCMVGFVKGMKDP